MRIRENQNNTKQSDLWQRIRYYLRFKSPEEGLKNIKKEDIIPLLIILLFGAICLACIVFIIEGEIGAYGVTN